MAKFQTESEEIFAAYLKDRSPKVPLRDVVRARLWVDFDHATVVCEVMQIEAEPPPRPKGTSFQGSVNAATDPPSFVTARA